MEIGLHFLEELLFTSKYYLGNTTIPFLIDFDRSWLKINTSKSFKINQSYSKIIQYKYIEFDWFWLFLILPDAWFWPIAIDQKKVKNNPK